MIDFKKIPTPRYGNYGGAGHSLTGTDPIDMMDALFQLHDQRYTAKDELKADVILVNCLKKLLISTSLIHNRTVDLNSNHNDNRRS